MYLMFDSSNELPQGSQLYVEYEMAVLSQLEAVPVKRTCMNCYLLLIVTLLFKFSKLS